MRNIFDALLERSELSAFRAVVKVAGMESVLSGDQPLTIFAPHDAAFKRFPEACFDWFLGSPETLARLLAHHMFSGAVLGGELCALRKARTLDGSDLLIAGRSCVRVDGVRILRRDIVCANGVIHVVERVLMPPSLLRYAPLQPMITSYNGSHGTSRLAHPSQNP